MPSLGEAELWSSLEVGGGGRGCGRGLCAWTGTGPDWRLGDPLFPLHFSCLFPPSPIADGGHVSAGRSLGKASWPGGSTGIGYQGTGWMFGSASFFALGVLLLGLERKMGRSGCEVQMRVLSLDSCRERTSAEKWRKVHCTAQGKVGTVGTGAPSVPVPGSPWHLHHSMHGRPGIHSTSSGPNAQTVTELEPFCSVPSSQWRVPQGRDASLFAENQWPTRRLEFSLRTSPASADARHRERGDTGGGGGCGT